jgi:hypothetical protein
MPNGKPGDNPYTDVVLHGMTVFGPVIDGLIRRVAETGGADQVVLRLLHDHDPRLGAAGCDPAAVEAKLRQVVAARERGGRPG